MAKLSKKTQLAFDEAVDRLGGGTPPIKAPKRSGRIPRPPRAARAKGRAKKR